MAGRRVVDSMVVAEPWPEDVFYRDDEGAWPGRIVSTT